MEQTIEVPLRLLLDLVDLAETASEQMRDADVAPALIDALHASAQHILTAITVPG